jgi:hypothetical protein
MPLFVRFILISVGTLMACFGAVLLLCIMGMATLGEPTLPEYLDRISPYWSGVLLGILQSVLGIWLLLHNYRKLVSSLISELVSQPTPTEGDLS